MRRPEYVRRVAASSNDRERHGFSRAVSVLSESGFSR
jgi:hypothetical protein